MKLTRHNLVNVAIVAAAVILVGGFILLASKGDNKGNSLDALAGTTTTTRRVTTTTAPVTTTVQSTTTTALSTGTTATTSKTTATTKKATTSTTKKPSSSSTTAVTGPSGPVNEHSDNTASFTHGPDGSFGASSTDPPSGADPFRFILKTAQGSGGVNGDTASVKFIVTLTNNTSKRIAFPGGLKIVVTMHAPSGGDLTFNMTAADVTDIQAGETITLTQERGVSGYGTFDASATCDVDYG